MSDIYLLPLFDEVYAQLHEYLVEYTKIGVLYVDVLGIQYIEEVLGWELFDEIVKILQEGVVQFSQQPSGYTLFPFRRGVWDDIAICVIPICKMLTVDELRTLAYALKRVLQEKVKSFVKDAGIETEVPLSIGYALGYYSGQVRTERLMKKIMEEGKRIARTLLRNEEQRRVEYLKDIIRKKEIRVVFHPIMKLQDEGIYGFECLARGPKHTIYEHPEYLFEVALPSGLTYELEYVIQLRILEVADRLPGVQFFINMEPQVLEMPGFEQLPILKKERLDMFVIEVTERVAVRDYKRVRLILDHLRTRGARIALDDVGSGYASLEAIAYLRPDFIKLDKNVIRGIHADFVKQAIVRTLVDLAHSIHASIIAEGIEKPDELTWLRSVEIPYGQGYFFSESVSHPQILFSKKVDEQPEPPPSSYPLQ